MKYDAVILANGEFPRKGGRQWELLTRARRVIACDGAGDVFRRRMHRAADFIVGDFDSAKKIPADAIVVKEQETNDLAKSIRFCRERGWKRLVVVGAMGKREDHLLGNVFIAMDEMVPIVTEYGTFLPFVGRIRLHTAKGAPISVFATNRLTKMSSDGLVWSLTGVEFKNLYVATLNRTSKAVVTITSNLPAFVYGQF